MSVYRGLETAPDFSAGCVLTVGNFDGVHLGHRRLIDTARGAAAGRLPVVVLTFDPHPAEVLTPGRAPPRLTTLDERLDLLERAGVDSCIIADARGGILRLEAMEFLRGPVARLHPRVIVEGPTFHFGNGRAGDVHLLTGSAGSLGVEVIVVEELTCDELPGRPPINSSSIREALKGGDVAAAAAMLGRPHHIRGVVVPGDARGRQIGFPTANLAEIPHLTPGFGVYACHAERECGDRHLAAVNVGPQPTFGQNASRVEAHLLDFDGELRGEWLALEFVLRLRGQRKFSGIDALRDQLALDVSQVRGIAASRPGTNLRKD